VTAEEEPALDREGGQDGPPGWRLRGAWTLPALAGRYAEFERSIADAARAPAPWDLQAVSAIDGAGALLLWRGWGHRRPAQLALQPEHEGLFVALERAPKAPKRTIGRVRKLPLLRRIGDHAADLTALTGQLVIDVARWLRHPGTIAWREISANVYRAGAQALPITALVGFLVGVTLSYLMSRQLKAFGADIFIVDILGIGIWREIGPLLAALLIAGRSGSAMTAQLGVMRVTQELDALAVMGISHTARLVLPKVLALAVAMPLVTVWTSLVMLAGGIAAAQVQLGLSPYTFLIEMPRAVPAWALGLGVAKSVGFGALIALVACHFGLRVKPDTESLGAGTTASVVAAITVVIILDAVVAIMFQDVGL
jgi:phospholipid/cholesterol/gamma-HCH transport system permease protein